MSRYYGICQKNVGRPVCIRTVDGREHRGVIHRVTNTHVHLHPLPSNLGGYGYGFWGPGAGFGWGLALGSIATLAILPFFFW
ncbi:hypothetical protein GCM10011351_30070 [Paraliobacillus quinghaiensis]|uniref:Uncharacterized protein n=1 Tax=Paraliobacillus quinghaiensis TaxID=470815 RepID=A0A917TWJ0_9BACI|nr:hypothetical protein [Paraliobacillus quinghaiensis]GGM41970.1 hypothetical protein GCM10011351_30070 [Paraliobacillus quinghaiensis]